MTNMNVTPLHGNTIGAQINRLLTNYSLSTMITCGNFRVQDSHIDEVACIISTNQIHVKHKHLSTEYCNKYELWMDSAVSYLINEIDNIAAPTILFFNTNENEKLFFDMFLTLKNVCKKTRIYVNRFCKDYDGNITIFEFFVDTAIHDSGVW